MGVIDWILIAVLFLIVGGALVYIVRAKRSGKKCIGCPDSKSCFGQCSACADCVHKTTEQKKK